MERTKSQKNIQVPSHVKTLKQPSPYDFVEFVPWACKQYGVDVDVRSIVRKDEPKRSPSKKIKMSLTEKRSKRSIKSDGHKEEKISSSSSLNFFEDLTSEKIRANPVVTAIFDHAYSLMGIKINSIVEVPRKLFQVIALILELYPSLTSLSANQRLDAYCIHEINKILAISSITEVCLDETRLKNPNYYILLETESNLNCLSLAKCQIDDEMIKKIAENLASPRPSAKTLRFLNISSNRITDTGAAHLAYALKTNRYLAYINLADNRITDTGASHIFDIMLAFPIMSEELVQFNIRRKQYLEEKLKLFQKVVVELKNTEESKSVKRKGNGKSPGGRRKSNKKSEEPLDKIPSLKSLAEVKVTTLDVKFFDQAEKLVLQEIGPIEDAFDKSFVKDDITYCTGNNTLTCLNLAYNNLSYNSLKKLIEVLNYQKYNQQMPRGLFRVRLEGNYLPSNCEEYNEINGLLDLALEASTKKPIKLRKRSIPFEKNKSCLISKV